MYNSEKRNIENDNGVFLDSILTNSCDSAANKMDGNWTIIWDAKHSNCYEELEHIKIAYIIISMSKLKELE